MHETYTLGYDRVAMAFVERRRLDINGAFFLPCLAAGMRVLDCGCGPGTITMDLAAGFAQVGASARYENFDPLTVITDLIAWQLDSSGCSAEASGLRQWAAQPAGMFAEAWVECVGRKPRAHAPQANS